MLVFFELHEVTLRGIHCMRLKKEIDILKLVEFTGLKLSVGNICNRKNIDLLQL